MRSSSGRRTTPLQHVATGVLALLGAACVVNTVRDVISHRADDLAYASHRTDLMGVGGAAIMGGATLAYYIVRALRPARDRSDVLPLVVTWSAGFIALWVFSLTIADWRFPPSVYFVASGIVWDVLLLGLSWLMTRDPSLPSLLRVPIVLLVAGEGAVAIAGTLRTGGGAMTVLAAGITVTATLCAIALLRVKPQLAVRSGGIRRST